jgi:triacylglycerol esterase/lipase EstA (alpha/beta hydrolase family)
MWNIKACIIWVKNQAKWERALQKQIMNQLFMDNENIFYGLENFKEEDVWEFQRNRKNDLHLQ